MNDHQQTLLRTLLTTPGPSGFEQSAAKVWRDEAKTFAEHVDHDTLGNSYAYINRDRSPLVVIEGHIDEIGFIVSYIHDDWFIWFDKIGGWDDQVIVGQRVRIASGGAEVSGVIGKKAAHLLKPADRERVTPSDELWIDIGASSKADAESRVEIGDPVVLDAQPIALTDDLWASRSADNRVGAFVALEALRLLAEQPPACGVVAVAATQEEINMSGAQPGITAQAGRSDRTGRDARDGLPGRREEGGQRRETGWGARAHPRLVDQPTGVPGPARGSSTTRDSNGGAGCCPIERDGCRRLPPFRSGHRVRPGVDPESLHAQPERDDQPEGSGQRCRAHRRFRPDHHGQVRFPSVVDGSERGTRFDQAVTALKLLPRTGHE